MSTAKKRPQLSIEELHRLKSVLGGMLALIAVSSLLYLDIAARGVMGLAFAGVLLALFRPGLAARMPALVHRLVFPVVVAYAAWDLYDEGEPLATLVRVVTLMLLYRGIGYRKRREDLQLLVLGLVLIVVAGVFTMSLAFAVQITVFAACAMVFLLLVTVVENARGGVAVQAGAAGPQPPPWVRIGLRHLASRVRETTDWRVFALGGLMFFGFVALAGLLFMAIPRFQLESGFFMDRMLTRKATTGFSDTLKFEDMLEIQRDDSVALRVEVSDRSSLPAVPYWRMVVLDEYRDSAFQMSAALKRAALTGERTAVRVMGDGPVRGGHAQWVFYLEPGVSRYLPLAGAFWRLTFAEPQSFRYSPSLGLVVLGRDPVAMKAYRVDHMMTGAVITEGAEPASAPQSASPRRRAQAPTMLEVALGEPDRETLRGIVAEIGGGRSLGAEEFSKAATIWLARRHPYSLDIKVPPGGGDRLVRWLGSTQGGHCELFAGSFALLARTAGHPTRVVTGFMGGTWNQDYLIVRNSTAHAWCEVSIGGGRWLRVDPTNDGRRLLAGGRLGEEVGSGVVQMNRDGWGARLDRLRLLWYRRIVNFDRADQLSLVRGVRERAESFGRGFREQWTGATKRIREWIQQPWDIRRGAASIGTATGFAVLSWLLWRQGPGWWRRLRRGRERGLDPVRREAGRWLGRLEPIPDEGVIAPVRAELLRLRYGRREGRPDVERVFRKARHALREARRSR